MSGEIISTFERDINELILEYLRYIHYNDTVESFATEMKTKGIIPSENQQKTYTTNADTFLELFHQGKKKEYFDLWNSTLSEKLRIEDTVCQKLEFYCQIYFATFAIRNDIQDKAIETIAMQEFREYLESKGAKLSKSTEFVRFYALPYVPNPRDHPSFSELFQDNWVPGLEMRLRRFFQLVLSNKKEPRIVRLYKNYNVDDNNVGLKQLQSKVVESERRAGQCVRRLNQVQIDYHALIGISAELVDMLEGSLQGVPVSPGQLQHVCQKLLTSQQHRLLLSQSISGDNMKDNKGNGKVLMNTGYDLSRPGTASMLLRQSVIKQPQHDEFENEQTSGRISKLKGPAKPKAINFSKVKHDIMNGDDLCRCLLLQALRWRLTKTDIDTRDKLLFGISQHDLLGVDTAADDNYRNVIHAIMNGDSGSEDVRQYLARFINAVASLNRGRSYMSNKTDICELLMTNIKSLINQESILRENLIGALQKLSLRRMIQSYMITNGMIEWLMSLLEENDKFSDYTLDYSVALLMNLCLRTSGKKRCVEHKTRILNVLSKMLNTFNTEITSYVNGALYSILVMPEIREEARNLNLEESLKVFIKPENPDMNRQIEYIINQLNSSDEGKVDALSDDEEDDEEEDPEVLEIDLDKEEVIPENSDVQGEALLASKYSHTSSAGRAPTLSRPVTPGTLFPKKDLVAVDIDLDAKPNETPTQELITSRPQTRAGSQQTHKSNKEESRPTTGSKVQTPQKKAEISAPPNEEYQRVFAEKPRVPRTPYHDPTSSSLSAIDKRNSVQSLSGPRPSSGDPVSANGNRKGRHSMSNSKLS